MPWFIDPREVPPSIGGSVRGFKFDGGDAPIALESLEQEYCRLTYQPYPITEMVFARSWMLFRVS